jgi:hypothetical protein
MAGSLLDTLPQDVANNIRAGALVSVALVLVFVGAVVFQAKVKFALFAEAKKKKERFLRWANVDARMVWTEIMRVD